MRARTLTRFSDLKAKKVREVGDEFEVTVERLNEINSASKSALVEVVKEEKKEIVKEATVKPKANKKK